MLSVLLNVKNASERKKIHPFRVDIFICFLLPAILTKQNTEVNAQAKEQENIEEINDIINFVLEGKRLEGKNYTNGNLNRIV